MYKFLSIILGVLLLVGGGFYGYEKYNHNKTKKEMNNRVAKLEQIVQETETAYSKMAVHTEDLETKKSELQKIIENRDEEIVAIGNVAVRWKDKYFEMDLLPSKMKVE